MGLLNLGLRLAWGTRGQRGRPLLVATAAGLGTLVLLVAMATLNGPRFEEAYYGREELIRLTLAVVAAIALPIAVMAATVGRLSASLRDRRLANLRLLGLSTTQTRIVAGVEAGAVAGLGSLAGTVVFAAAAALHAVMRESEVTPHDQQLWPAWVGYLVASAGVPILVTAVSSLPQRLDARRTLERARKADAHRPSWLRAVPLLVGLGMSVASWNANADHQLTDREIAVLFGGIGLTGLGLIIVAPVFVRLLADLLHRLARGPVANLAARRLQAQPAGVTRVIAVLMLGLFLVVGARGVVAAFESTPQYRQAELLRNDRQWAVVLADADQAPDQARLAESVTGVRDVVVVPWLTAQNGSQYRPGQGTDDEVVVATCAQLTRLAPTLSGCVDGEPLWLYPFGERRMPSQITLAAANDNEEVNGLGSTLTITPGDRVATPSEGKWYDDLGPVGASLVLPPDTPGLGGILTAAQRQIVVIAEPGSGLPQDLEAAGAFVNWAPDPVEYDFVAGLRRLVYLIAAIILSLGLLTFAIAAIDRALARRRELASLHLIGTPASVLRRAQWLEALLPTLTGTLLAIAAGWFAGQSYLRIDGEWIRHLERVVPTTLGVAAAAVVGSFLVAGLTVIATGGKVTSDLIRTE